MDWNNLISLPFRLLDLTFCHEIFENCHKWYIESSSRGVVNVKYLARGQILCIWNPSLRKEFLCDWCDCLAGWLVTPPDSLMVRWPTIPFPHYHLHPEQYGRVGGWWRKRRALTSATTAQKESLMYNVGGCLRIPSVIWLGASGSSTEPSESSTTELHNVHIAHRCI